MKNQCKLNIQKNNSYPSVPQADDSDGRKRRLKQPETAIKRCFNALNFAVFYRNPSSRITRRFFRWKPAIVFRRILQPGTGTSSPIDSV